jgi:hypothetical protein
MAAASVVVGVVAIVAEAVTACRRLADADFADAATGMAFAVVDAERILGMTRALSFAPLEPANRVPAVDAVAAASPVAILEPHSRWLDGPGEPVAILETAAVWFGAVVVWVVAVWQPTVLRLFAVALLSEARHGRPGLHRRVKSRPRHQGARHPLQATRRPHFVPR